MEKERSEEFVGTPMPRPRRGRARGPPRIRLQALRNPKRLNSQFGETPDATGGLIVDNDPSNREARDQNAGSPDEMFEQDEYYTCQEYHRHYSEIHKTFYGHRYLASPSHLAKLTSLMVAQEQPNGHSVRLLYDTDKSVVVPNHDAYEFMVAAWERGYSLSRVMRRLVEGEQSHIERFEQRVRGLMADADGLPANRFGLTQAKRSSIADLIKEIEQKVRQ